MHVGIFINTPAHAHLYRETVRSLDECDVTVSVFARDDSCTCAILDYYSIPYHVYGTRQGGRFQLALELPGHLHRIRQFVSDRSLDLVFGMGVYSTYAAWLADATAITVMDSEPLALKQRLTAPIVGAFLTPASFRGHLGPKHFVFDGFKETAYLHPAINTQSGDSREALQLTPGEPFTIVRFNAFNGHHDMGKRGFSDDEKRELIKTVAQHGTVVVSDEASSLDLDRLPARPFDAHPAVMHDALAEAQLLIADTQTMVTEAGLLGTPAIRSNSFVGDDDMGNFHTLADAELIWNCQTFEEVLDTAKSILQNETMDQEMQRRRDAFLANKCNLTEVFVDLIGAVANGSSLETALYRNPALQSKLSTAGDRKVIPNEM